MYLYTLATALLSIASTARAVSIDAKSCQNGPWSPPVYTGQPWEATPDSQYFCEGGHADGNVLTGIKVWRGDWGIWAMKFKWGDDEYGDYYGYPGEAELNTPTKTVEWDASASVFIRLFGQKLKNHGDQIDGVGQIIVEVNGESKLDLKSDHVGPEIFFSGGAGKILAVEGRAKRDVTLLQTLQFLYLESKIVRSSMTSATYSDSMEKYNQEKKNIQSGVSIFGLWVRNPNPEGGLNQTYLVTPKVDIVDTRTMTTTNTHAVGVSLGVETKVEAGIPGLIESGVTVSAGASYDFTHTESTDRTKTFTQSFGWSSGGPLLGFQPQTAIHCQVYVKTGTFSSDYTAEITATLENGKTFKFKETGHLETVRYVDATQECLQHPIADAPENSLVGEDVKKGRRALSFSA